ncbi:MAG: type IV toxin-antitoxin system AbiEi family antitoxin domain-containing protein [Solirubrobacteraceae bacterium]
MHPDERVVAIAGRRHGVISSAELADAGLSRRAVSHRVGRGWLHRMHRGVYLVGPLEAPLSRAAGAVLAIGEGAVLSHHSSAAVWDLLPLRNGSIAVILPARDARRRPGIELRRIRHLDPKDIRRHRALPLTSPARTLLDLATTLPQRDLDRAVEEAQVKRRVSIHSLNEQFARYPGHRGAAALTRAMKLDPAFTRREAERRMLELIRAARLPAPEVNARLNGYEVDFLWRERHLVVETDGYAFHSSRGSFENDRRRDRHLQTEGYVVLRITWRELKAHPEAVVAELAAALTRRA